ncbi:HPP family protein [Halopiger thermotolerans]
MLEGPRSRWGAIASRLRRIERRELRELRAWIERTRNLIHLSALLFVPLVIAAVTALSNAVDALPFLLFPPLASGTYTLFAEPESQYASPRRFVGGMTVGALCGWVALETAARYASGGSIPQGSFEVHAGAAAFAIFLTSAVTWVLGLEESQAFSTALLVLVTHPVDSSVSFLGTVPGHTGAALAYVLSVFVSTSLVAVAFVGWRRWVYERRARLLYASTTADDAVLVPMRGDHPNATATLGARLAAAHDAGKVVLLDVVDDEAVADGAADAEARDRAADRLGSETAESLEEYARRIESAMDVPCQVVVAAGDPDDPSTVLEAARRADCDLIVAPYESSETSDGPSSFVRELIHGGIDVLVHRAADGREADEWNRVLVPVRGESDLAHAMIDFATRLAGADGTVSVCHCLSRDRDRRRADEMLARLVEPFDGQGQDDECGIETRIATDSPEAFVSDHAPRYDLALVGASTDRTTVSRFVSASTADRLEDLECDLGIVATARG